METLSVHVSADLAEAVRLAAAVAGVSVAEEIRIALAERTKRAG
jgi:Ribbon-helix-helix protein, copG family